MSRPPLSPDELATPEACAGIKALRKTLFMGRERFAAVIGMTRMAVINREDGRTPWRRTEIATAEARVREHLLAALAKLDALEF